MVGWSSTLFTKLNIQMKKYPIFLLIYIYQIIIQEESIFIRKRCRKKEKENKKECQNEVHARMKKWKLPLEIQGV